MKNYQILVFVTNPVAMHSDVYSKSETGILISTQEKSNRHDGVQMIHCFGPPSQIRPFKTCYRPNLFPI